MLCDKNASFNKATTQILVNGKDVYTAWYEYSANILKEGTSVITVNPNSRDSVTPISYKWYKSWADDDDEVENEDGLIELTEEHGNSITINCKSNTYFCEVTQGDVTETFNINIYSIKAEMSASQTEYTVLPTDQLTLNVTLSTITGLEYYCEWRLCDSVYDPDFDSYVDKVLVEKGGTSYTLDCSILPENKKSVIQCDLYAKETYTDDDGNVQEEYYRTDDAYFYITVTDSEHTHSYTSETVNPTCTADGYKKYTCACGATYTETIPATGHQNTEIKNAKEATCLEEGYTGDTYCTACGAEIAKGQIISKLNEHTWNQGEVTKAATCTEKGIKTYTCSFCGTTKTEEIDLSDHNWVAGDVTKTPTCTESGTQKRTCSTCGIEDIQTLPATGHQTVVRNQVAASYTSAGYTGDVYCSVCGALISKGQETNALTLGVPVLKKLKSAKKAISVKCVPASGASGIQVQYSLKKSMAKAKTKTLSGTSAKLSKLSGKKKYYVRIRSYVNTANGKVYSAWSGVKAVKTK